MLLADIEVGVLGDGLSNALRQALHAPATQPPAHAGAALLLRETVGGNGRTVLLGCVQPSDYDESASTLQLLNYGMSVRTFPLVNGATTRGMLRRHYWHTQQLQERPRRPRAFSPRSPTISHDLSTRSAPSSP